MNLGPGTLTDVEHLRMLDNLTERQMVRYTQLCNAGVKTVRALEIAGYEQ